MSSKLVMRVDFLVEKFRELLVERHKINYESIRNLPDEKELTREQIESIARMKECSFLIQEFNNLFSK